MSPKRRVWLEVAVVVVGVGVLLLLTSCASVPYMRASVQPDGTVQAQQVTDYTIPPTGIVLWSAVETADGDEWTEVPDGPLPIPGLPWWAQVAAALAIRAVATKSGRANLKSVVAPDAVGIPTRVASLVASTGVWSSTAEAVGKRAAAEPAIAAKVAESVA